MTAFALGLVQFAAPKGTLPHRTIGFTGALVVAGLFTLAPGRIRRRVIFGA